jgi:hypothetical protein
MYEYDWSRIPCSDPREYIELREEFVYFFLLPQYRSSRKPGRRQRSGRSPILNKKEFILTINISVK